MKPVYILGVGTLSTILAIAKFFFPIPWFLVTLPLAAPMAYAFGAFLVVIIHALGTGKLEIAPPPVANATAETKADSAVQTK